MQTIYKVIIIIREILKQIIQVLIYKRKILTGYNNNNDNHRSELLHSLIYAAF